MATFVYPPSVSVWVFLSGRITTALVLDFVLLIKKSFRLNDLPKITIGKG